MALFSLDVEKFLRNEFWTNRYIVDLASVTSGFSVAEAVVAAEREVTIGDVTITKVRVSDQIAGTDSFVIYQFNVECNRVVTSQALPLFDVARVDFSTGIGRPSRKYLRGVLAEEDQENYGDLVTSTVTFINTNYVVPMLAIPEYVDVDGDTFVTGSCNTQVGMRQLRRGSRRRATPIL